MVGTVTKRNTKFNNLFSEENYTNTYKHHTDNDINDTHLRVAKDLALAEKEDVRDHWTEKFLDVLENFQFVPGGRIISNAGTNWRGTTLINCFVDGFYGECQDSMDSIMNTVRRQALILKSEGGYGFCADVLRPRGSFIYAIANESPGMVKFLDIWDTVSDVVTSGSGKKKSHVEGKSKIRKGAMMVTASCWHPDIEEFITIKQTSGKLTKFNMSVMVTDEFMDAVTNHKPWKLEFPDYEQLFQSGKKKQYNKYWDGNLVAWKKRGLPVKVYKEFPDANDLWNLIMKSTYGRNEPGVIFIDTVNRFNNLYYCEHLNSCNPCGEQYLPWGGVCLLGSLNLTQFINGNDWDWDKLSRMLPIIIRMMDNVNDRTRVPLDEQKENLQQKRRMGLGVLGYASALMMLKLKYGSLEALEMTDKLMDFIMNRAYRESALLAKEKGAFPLYDPEKYLSGQFIQKLSDGTRDLIRQYGIRNSHLLSIQPTGNTGVLCNNVSTGLEPVFSTEYVRSVVQSYPPEGIEVPQGVDWNTKTFTSTSTPWEWKRENGENILATKLGNDIFKFDRSRGLLKEVWCHDYAVKYLQDKDEWDPTADWASCADQLTLADHVRTMEVFAKHLDSAMSKTVNISNDYPYEDFQRLYLDVYQTGVIKGCTTFRVGTQAAVLTTTVDDKPKITKTRSPKRPISLPCDIHQITAAGKKWVVLVGLMEGDPYEVFAFQYKNIYLPAKTKRGTLTKIQGNGYDLECEDGLMLKDIKELFESDEHEALTRMISTALRHGADIEFIVAQLMKSKGTITSFGRAVGRTLKEYIHSYKSMKCMQCHSKNLVMEDKCAKCLDCGFSGCG